MEIDAVYGDKGKKGKHAKGKKGNTRKKDCRYENTVAEVDE